ncbi:hypothetical protein L211DRAFT_877042 [Terfezia boudieri ATCC MYA-4762]|uniref:Uncharacterized protein n=1 Tax=Terfezia boudieri ATCC MYA-4762 TaxID=1051890 RepID=A0A3N4L917_9PEZI|nr:hypothetical protein L211DRAFT_877042 [Terfezia boudieri ATCC MYA-4762]
MEILNSIETGDSESAESGRDKDRIEKKVGLKKRVEENPLRISFSPARSKKERERGRKELNKSKYAIPELSAEQVESIARKKVEGGDKIAKGKEEENEEEEDEEMEEEEEGEETEAKWNGI